MKTQIVKLMLFISPIVFSSCKAQPDKGKKTANSISQNTTVTIDSSGGPAKYKVKVNKQYDSTGHLIKYDSSYSYSYTGVTGNRTFSKNDTVYRHFKSFFEKAYPDFSNNLYDNLFYNDSLFKYDFFNPDYFRRRYELNNQMFENMFHRMDSLKNQYMKENYPNGIQKKQ